MVQAADIAQVMGGRSVLRLRVSSVSDLERAIAGGLPKAALRRTAERVFPRTRSAQHGAKPTDRGEAQRLIYRTVPEATYKRRTRLSPAEGERTERLARVIANAEFVWADPKSDAAGRQQAHAWLTLPHPELENRTPLECAATELGARQVEQVLARLLYGLPA